MEQKKLNVVISGCFTESAFGHYGRTAAREAIIGMGCNVRSEMNKSTDYLVVGAANVPGRGVGPAKLEKAKALDIPVVTLDELKRRLAAYDFGKKLSEIKQKLSPSPGRAKKIMENNHCGNCGHCKEHSVYLKSYYCNLRGDSRYVQDNKSVDVYACACRDWIAR